MRTITIPEAEYLKMQQTIKNLQQQVSLFNDRDFVTKLNLAYQLFLMTSKTTSIANPKISIKRGAGKHLIKYMAEDFTAPIEDFKDYM